MGEVTERDREIARKWLLVHIEGSHEGDAIFLAEFIAQVRAEEQERCARIAEKQSDESSKAAYAYDGGSGSMGYEQACNDIAQAIWEKQT